MKESQPPFVRINKSTLQGLSLRERGLITLIAEYCYITNRDTRTGFLYRNPCKASIATLAERSQCHRNTICRMLSRLEKKGAIRTERRKGRPPRIHLIDSPDRNEDVFDFKEPEKPEEKEKEIDNRGATESVKKEDENGRSQFSKLCKRELGIEVDLTRSKKLNDSK